MLVVDVETGGLDPKVNPLLSIGAVDFENNSDTFYVEIKAKPDQICDPYALTINDRDPNTGENLTDAMLSFHEWLSDKSELTLAGHNPVFDKEFCNHNFERIGHFFRFNHRTIDLHTLAYAYTGKMLSYDSIFKVIGMEPEPKPHNALNGARYEESAIRELLLRLNGGYDGL